VVGGAGMQLPALPAWVWCNRVCRGRAAAGRVLVVVVVVGGVSGGGVGRRWGVGVGK